MPAASARPHAPAFPKGFSWFNTDRPLAFDSDLKGRIVVMDFWTYCCINCMHMLPELAKVEEHYRGRPVVIIGVHSNKFANEGDAANVRAAILRYKIRHPVIVDEGHRIWDEYTVRAWPTLMFVDAEGRVVGRLEGENSADTIIRVIDGLLAEGEASGALAAGPPRLRPEQMVPSSSGLAFPGKVLADPAGNRLFIADSGHNRIIQASLEGKISAIYGSGEPGLADGPAASARFNNPQGMALDGAAGLLFVADTDNHALRQINLATGDVTTIAGTGMIGNDRRGGGIGTAQPLNSPWALALDKNTLYIAMA
ncbi:redoxin domain-containing protein, partial [bacterium]|nr:redoxin domain-containing protein [bacterium]